MHRRSWLRRHGLAGLCGLVVASVAVAAQPTSKPAEPKRTPWRGVHMFSPSPGGLPVFKRAVAEVLAPLGVNVLVVEVNYKFDFQSHPELRAPGAISKVHARELTDVCRAHGIRLIPQFNCLGHQSWSTSTLPLLTRYPELDETPNVPKDNKGIYCRSWCPLHPRVNPIVFALIDELIDAFGSDAFHVGMDEVFLIASSQCPRCCGKDPAELFAKAVNDLHAHVVGRRKQTMLMWGDRLIDGKVMKYGAWEASLNGTAAAVDQIPKDIIICDWHYGLRKDYPSVRYFQQKGFRVWPSSWRPEPGAVALLECARRDATDRMIGHLCTTWVGATPIARALLSPPDKSKGSTQVAQAAAALRACMARLE